jgi:metallo-beta-lactamase family protein
MKISFYGGAGMVTGSNFLLESENSKIVIDCGLFQGCGESCTEVNSKPFAYDPASIDTLLVTHAHMDHIGRIPKLVKDGFVGKIYSTKETRQLAELMLEDSVGLMDKDAKLHNKEPIYDESHVRAALQLWKGIEYHESIDVGGSVNALFKDAGHVLGSAMIELSRNGKKMIFSGDIGSSPSILLRDTETLGHIDYLVLESTYGASNHEPKEKRIQELQTLINDTWEHKGALIIPAFSLERSQEILYDLNELVEGGLVKQMPVFLDSPLAIKITEIYKGGTEYFNDEVKARIAKGDNIFEFPKLKITLWGGESRKIADTPKPKIIIAGGGMSTGGRILFHEQIYLPDANNTLAIVGYQAVGSLGRQIEEGSKEVIIHGETVPVRAKIACIKSYSGHKDMDEIISFVEPSAKGLKKVFLVHGEMKQALFLAQRVRDYLGVDGVVPKIGDSYEFDF